MQKNMTCKTDDVWRTMLYELTREGQFVSPRGMKTAELLGYQSIVDMNRPVLTVPKRKLGYRFLAAEAAWILSGDNRVSTIQPYSSQIPQFSDDGMFFFGAYGPKIIDQLHYVVDCLHNDQSSRQAVINIWREKPRKTKDVPCTISAQFMIRNNMLYCFDTMRSSDAWLGWPYDVFNFSMLSAYIVLCLRKLGHKDLSLGTLTLTAASQHLYDRELDKAIECLDGEMFPVDYKPLCLSQFRDPEDLKQHLWALAQGKFSQCSGEFLLDLPVWRQKKSKGE